MGSANTAGILAGLLVLGAAAGTAASWEIGLRAEVATTAPIVRLGDVAEIAGLDPQASAPLQRIVVAPGPTRTYSRTITVSDIRTLLAARGVDLSQCQFSGSPRALVSHGDQRTAASQPSDNPVQPTTYRRVPRATGVDQVVQRVEELAAEQFQQLAGDAAPWTVTVSLPPRTEVRPPANWSELTIEGIEQPQEGTHQLTAHLSTDAGDIRLPLEAEARRMRQVVVPVRDVEKGRVLRAADVRLTYVNDENAQGKAYRRMEEVIGRQTRQTVKAGRPLDSSSVVEPLLIRRRDTIEVININGAITIRRPAMALEDGAHGDTISVETLDGSKVQFVARVIGVKLAEVAAVTPRVERHAGELQ